MAHKEQNGIGSGQFDCIESAKFYALAGKATLTLVSQKTGARYTYRINRCKDDNGEYKDLWFVGLLTGADNESSYTYMGVINGTFKLTAKSKYKPDSIPVRAFSWFWRHLENGEMPPDTEVLHAGSCGRCGRTLTVPESIKHGFGPECASKLGL